MSREQRRAEGIAAINAEIVKWATDPDSVVFPLSQTNLAQRLFDLQPAYWGEARMTEDEAISKATAWALTWIEPGEPEIIEAAIRAAFDAVRIGEFSEPIPDGYIRLGDAT
jgi:hypothetical protein